MNKLDVACAAIFMAACGQAPDPSRDTAPTAEPKGGLSPEALPITGCASGGWIVASTGGCLFGSQYGVGPSACGPSESGECWTFSTSGFGQFQSYFTNGQTNYGMGTSFALKGGGPDDYQVTDYNSGGPGTQNGPQLLLQWWAGAIGADINDRGNPQSCLVSAHDQMTIFAMWDSADGCSTPENMAYANQMNWAGIGFQAAIVTNDYTQPGWGTTYLSTNGGNCNGQGTNPTTVAAASGNSANGIAQPTATEILRFEMPGIGQPGYPAAGFTIAMLGCAGSYLSADGSGNLQSDGPGNAHHFRIIRDTATGSTQANVFDVDANGCVQWLGVGVQPHLTSCNPGDGSEWAYPTYANP